MVHYISKDALVAEIEKRIKEISKEFQESKYIQYTLLGKINALENLLPFLDTLEVKEINSTDAFIEKACEFFGEHLWEYINVKNANCDTFINIDGDKLIEDFKKYMKGE